MRVAVIFPGQGSQSLGMGADVAAKSDVAASLFARASVVLGYDLLALQSLGPEEKLRETCYSQPAIFVTNLALAMACGDALNPVVSAGHSFGEFCSLTLAGALEFEDALRIVDERGKAMQAAAEQAPGGMSAVLGLDPSVLRDVVERIRTESGLRIQLANFNAPGQIVISGDLEAVAQAGQRLLEAGAKRVVQLNVSGAWHSELMKPAEDRFARAVAAGSFSLPRFDVISNLDASVYHNTETMRTHLVRSLTSEVRWHETALKLMAYEPDIIVEFGASPVLGPMVKRLPEIKDVRTISEYSGVEKLLGLLIDGAVEA